MPALCGSWMLLLAYTLWFPSLPTLTWTSQFFPQSNQLPSQALLSEEEWEDTSFQASELQIQKKASLHSAEQTLTAMEYCRGAVRWGMGRGFSSNPFSKFYSLDSSP